jgi:ribosomal protein S14
MTTATDTQPPLWGASDTVRRQSPGPARTSCALCTSAPPATPLGLCRECLSAAAAEHTVITPASDRRLSAVQYRDLCRRCGSSRHPISGCDA